MWTTLRQLRGRLAASPNRIAFAWALRGTIATGLPLVALPALGLGPLSNFVVIGALNTSMVDVGGSYRSRLTARRSMRCSHPWRSFSAVSLARTGGPPRR